MEETLQEAAEKYSKRSSAKVFQQAHIEDFKAGAKWQLSQLIEKLEMHILINEDDWNRNPKAQFKDFIKQFNQK